MLKDHSINKDDVKNFVDAFYSKVRAHEALGPVFNEYIGNNWDNHHKKLYGFWETYLLRNKAYTGDPFAVHSHLKLQNEHFDAWLHLFNLTVDELLQGEIARTAKRTGSLFVHSFKKRLGLTVPN
ncbi:MAG: group III truncated hemoglobin [Bacteroidales bacterium]|nr:group III truncated hemoglobin [Bacteroidales bacterium]